VVTADEFLRVRADGWRYELIDGELRRRPYLSVSEGTIAANLIGSLSRHGDGVVLASAGFHLRRDPDTVLVAEVAFVRDEAAITDGFFEGAPVVACFLGERNTSDWFIAGLTAAIVVDPTTHNVRVHRHDGVFPVTDTLELPDILPGWQLPLTELFT
jgi:Uma2 family endonuclease